MRVVVVGAGRVGRALAAAAREADHAVVVAGRTDAIPSAELVVVAVTDAAIADVVPRLPRGVPAVHCAGALGAEALHPHRPAGTLHPLMTFPADLPPSWAGTPAGIDGDAEAVGAATELARSLGMRPFTPPADRALYHAAAALAGNYASVLLVLGARALQAGGVDAAGDLLLPLAVRSLENAARHGGAAITGPAARGDLVTLARHREALDRAGLADLLPLYDMLADRARSLSLSGEFTAPRK